MAKPVGEFVPIGTRRWRLVFREEKRGIPQGGNKCLWCGRTIRSCKGICSHCSRNAHKRRYVKERLEETG